MKLQIEECGKLADAVLESIADDWTMPVEEIEQQIEGALEVFQEATTRKERAFEMECTIVLEIIEAAKTIARIVKTYTEDPDEAFELGYMVSILHRSKLLSHPDFAKNIVSLAGYRAGKDQWKTSNDAYQKAKADAEKYWQNGETLYHNDLARQWAKERGLSAQKLMDLFKPIARPFGKVRGEKK